MGLREDVSEVLVQTLEGSFCKKVNEMLTDPATGYNFNKRRGLENLIEICYKKFKEKLEEKQTIRKFYDKLAKINRSYTRCTPSTIIFGTRYFINGGKNLSELLLFIDKLIYVLNNPKRIYDKYQIYPSFIVMLQENTAYQYDPLSLTLGTLEFLYNFAAFYSKYKNKGLVARYRNGKPVRETTIFVPSKIPGKGYRKVILKGLDLNMTLDLESDSELTKILLELKKIYNNNGYIYPKVIDEYVTEAILLLNTLGLGISEDVPLFITPAPKKDLLIAALNLYKTFNYKILEEKRIPRLKFYLGIEIVRYYNNLENKKSFDSPRIWTRGYIERLLVELHLTKIITPDILKKVY